MYRIYCGPPLAEKLFISEQSSKYPLLVIFRRFAHFLICEIIPNLSVEFTKFASFEIFIILDMVVFIILRFARNVSETFFYICLR